MPRACRTDLLAALAGATLLLSACGGDGTSTGGAPPGTTVSPIAQLMGWESLSPEEANQRQLQVEELTAQCMREEGWEYAPVDWSTAATSPGGGPDQEEIDLRTNDPEAYGKQYGYGIVRDYELYDLPNIESGDGSGPMATMVAQDFQDPNQPYVDSLTDAERDQYYASLNGDPSIWDGSNGDGWVQPSPDQMGCQGKSSAQVWGNEAQSDPDVQERVNDYYANLEDDPRIQDAYADWRDCIGDAIDGLTVLDEPVANPSDLNTYLNNRKYALTGLEIQPYSPDDDDGSTPYVMAMVEADGTGIAYVGEQHPIPEADLEDLRQEELRLWQDDWSCQRKAEIDDVRQQLEQEFADQLRTDFPDLATGG